MITFTTTSSCFGDEPLTYKTISPSADQSSAMIMCPNNHLIHLHPDHSIDEAGVVRGVSCEAGCNFESDILLEGWLG